MTTNNRECLNIYCIGLLFIDTPKTFIQIITLTPSYSSLHILGLSDLSKHSYSVNSIDIPMAISHSPFLKC